MISMLKRGLRDIAKVMPFLDQGATALFNFLFVFTTSLLLSAEEFAFANYGFLAILFVVNVGNALVFQPYLRTIAKGGFASVRRMTLYAVLVSTVISVIASPLLYVIGKNLGMPDGAIYLTVLILYASMAYELGRRMNMLQGRWDLNLLYGMSLSLLMLLALLVVQPDKASDMLAMVLAAYTILGAPMLLLGLGKALRSSVSADTVEVISDTYWESLRYGALLLGGAIAFWFISGGYLLIVAKFVPTYDIAVLRATQNLMNGVLLIFTALDNYVLSGQARRLVKQPASAYGFLVSIVALYSILAYGAFVLIYPSMRSFAYLIAIWAVVYLLTTFARLWISILKWHGDARSVLTGQVSGVAFFMLLVGLAALLDLQPGAAGVTLFWLLSSLVVFVVVLSNVRVALRNGSSFS